ncbi:Protein of unknown function [Streptosporangium canum]|uniref:DUF3152 domain-containing protein n=1 Tax=Streptosporangium canum TaxID=324952 RepID=A0A1I4D1J9_9ACTN|nr:Protein of unknown function [Streptosporangium canum]
MFRNVKRCDLKSVVWVLALSISASLLVGGSALLSGHLAPVPDGPISLPDRAAPPAAPLPEVSVTPTPPPEPTAAPEAEQTFLLANGRRQPPKMAVPKSAGGRYTVVPGGARPPAGRTGKVIRYLVEVERGLPFEGRAFADEVHRILNDRRSWGFRFQRVERGPVKIRVSLSSPAMTDRRCHPLITFGTLSCWNDGRAVINAVRWNTGVRGYGRDVASYREYVINHEVGHGLGHGHQPCPGPGRRAPVMLQQTKSLYGCRPNAWPSPRR